MLTELCDVAPPKRGRTQLTPSGCPDDDLVLATALAAQVDVIITGDKDLLTLKRDRGVRIRTPRQFMDAPKA